MAGRGNLSPEDLFTFSYPTPRGLHRLAQEKDRQKGSNIFNRLFKSEWREIGPYDETQLRGEASKRYEVLIAIIGEKDGQRPPRDKTWQAIAQLEKLARREPPFSGKAHAILAEASDFRKAAEEASNPTGLDLSPKALDTFDLQRVQSTCSLVIEKVRKHLAGQDRDVALRRICQGLIAVNCGEYAMAVVDEFIKSDYEKLWVLTDLAQEVRKKLRRDELDRALDKMSAVAKSYRKHMFLKAEALEWVGDQLVWGGRFSLAIEFTRVVKRLDRASFFVSLSRAMYMRDFLAMTPLGDEICDFRL